MGSDRGLLDVRHSCRGKNRNGNRSSNKLKGLSRLRTYYNLSVMIIPTISPWGTWQG